MTIAIITCRCAKTIEKECTLNNRFRRKLNYNKQILACKPVFFETKISTFHSTFPESNVCLKSLTRKKILKSPPPPFILKNQKINQNKILYLRLVM